MGKALAPAIYINSNVCIQLVWSDVMVSDVCHGPAPCHVRVARVEPVSHASFVRDKSNHLTDMGTGLGNDHFSCGLATGPG